MQQAEQLETIKEEYNQGDDKNQNEIQIEKDKDKEKDKQKEKDTENNDSDLQQYLQQIEKDIQNEQEHFKDEIKLVASESAINTLKNGLSKWLIRARSQAKQKPRERTHSKLRFAYSEMQMAKHALKEQKEEDEYVEMMLKKMSQRKESFHSNMDSMSSLISLQSLDTELEQTTNSTPGQVPESNLQMLMKLQTDLEEGKRKHQQELEQARTDREEALKETDYAEKIKKAVKYDRNGFALDEGVMVNEIDMEFSSIDDWEDSDQENSDEENGEIEAVEFDENRDLIDSKPTSKIKLAEIDYTTLQQENTNLKQQISQLQQENEELRSNGKLRKKLLSTLLQKYYNLKQQLVSSGQTQSPTSPDQKIVEITPRAEKGCAANILSNTVSPISPIFEMRTPMKIVLSQPKVEIEEPPSMSLSPILTTMEPIIPDIQPQKPLDINIDLSQSPIPFQQIEDTQETHNDDLIDKPQQNAPPSTYDDQQSLKQPLIQAPETMMQIDDNCNEDRMSDNAQENIENVNQIIEDKYERAQQQIEASLNKVEQKTTALRQQTLFQRLHTTRSSSAVVFPHVQTKGKKEARQAMPGHACDQCVQFALFCKEHGVTTFFDFSRHRHDFSQPPTPEGYWDLKMETLEETPQVGRNSAYKPVVKSKSVQIGKNANQSSFIQIDDDSETEDDNNIDDDNDVFADIKQKRKKDYSINSADGDEKENKDMNHTKKRRRT
ncbi:MAG: hypothetical protein EZS28_011402 [Streblomastix strix]|uniref:DNA endonuclease activator Ctp1 C-terminal domain-containing protein n=1 Tax=Streblomastix strix TaxID=222440 RepID=A0A5J4WDQ3_9EUKA|nr:MAG: hypothetical protein EZS28_011402 [Streblomastix strix]